MTESITQPPNREFECHEFFREKHLTARKQAGIVNARHEHIREVDYIISHVFSLVNLILIWRRVKMHSVNSMAANFGKYDLDVSAVGMRSISETDIKLPYTGVLPVQMSASSGAYVYLNVQLAQGARLVLVAHGKGKDIKRPLEASSEEIIALLDGFFKQNQDATGLAQYWLGVWQAHYTEWRKIVTGPDRLLTILSSLSVTDREFLCKHMMDVPATE